MRGGFNKNTQNIQNKAADNNNSLKKIWKIDAFKKNEKKRKSLKSDIQSNFLVSGFIPEGPVLRDISSDIILLRKC